MPSRNDNQALFQRLVFRQLKRRGRLHLRGLLGAMRKRLDVPATEPSQEIAMLLRGKLRLRAPRMHDVEAVRRILEGAQGDGP